MTFNPKNYAKRSDEVVENYEKREKWRAENKHLALPFFIEGLRDLVPAIYPEEMAMIGAPSGDGKTKILKTWHRQAQRAITEAKRRAVTVFGSQEETTERLLAEDIEQNQQIAASTPSVFIGASFGMSADDIEDIHMTNYISTLAYIRDDMFAEKMPMAANFYDYITATPNDPNRRESVTDSAYRHQINDNVRRLFQSTKTFHCPLVTASQTGLKTLNTPYSKEIPIAGRGDFAEASTIFTIPDFVYSFVHMRNASTVGMKINSGNWSFTVEKNLLFFWFLKARGHDPEKTAQGLGRVFPIRIINDEYVYEKEYHLSMLVNKAEVIK